ncbi:MAG: hypothetical protein WCT26_01215 [Candidatus Buchananbacteria bacterium]|jgi:hypothetical protein
MAEQNNESQTARGRDQLQQELAIASSIAEKQARKPAETKTISNENNATDDSNPEEIENNLGEQKGIENKKPSAIENATKEIGNKILKEGTKGIAKKAAMNPGTWIIIVKILFWLAMGILALFLIFNIAMAYRCWEEGGKLNKVKMLYQYWTEDYVGVLNKVYSGTCAVSDTPVPDSTKNPPVSKPTPAANIAPDTTAQ